MKGQDCAIIAQTSDSWIAVKSMSSLRRNVIDVEVRIDVHVLVLF